MKTILMPVLCMICASFTVGACSYFDTAGGAGATAEMPGNKIDLTSGEGRSVTNLSAQNIDLSEMATRNSRGSVTMYAFDEDLPEDARAYRTPKAQVIEAGRRTGLQKPIVPQFAPPKSGLPGQGSVKIFPLDDSMEEVMYPKFLQQRPPQSREDLAALQSSKESLILRPPPSMREFISLQVGRSEPSIIYFEPYATGLDEEAIQVIADIAARYYTSEKSEGILVKPHGRVTPSGEAWDDGTSQGESMMQDRLSAIRAELAQRGVPVDQIVVDPSAL